MCNVPMKMVSRSLTCQQAAIFTIKGGDETLRRSRSMGGCGLRRGVVSHSVSNRCKQVSRGIAASCHAEQGSPGLMATR